MSSPFWLRVIELTVGDKQWIKDNSGGLEIKFDTTSKAKTESDGADVDLNTVSIYNLSADSRNAIKKGDKVILNAGYKGNVGNLIIGRVESIEVEREGLDIVTRLSITDGGLEWKQAAITKTYQPGSKADYIMRDIANTMGYEVSMIKPNVNIEYKLGKSVSGKCGNILKQLVKDTDSKMYINKNRLYIMPKKDGIKNGFLLNSQHGLLESPKRQETSTDDNKSKISFSVRSKLNHELTVNSFIIVESITLNGRVRIEEVKHSSEFETELTVVEV